MSSSPDETAPRAAGAAEEGAAKAGGSLVGILVRVLKLVLAVGLMALLVRSNALDPKKIAGVLARPEVVVGVLLLGSFNLSTSALRWWLLLQGEGIACSIGLALRLTWIGHFWNMVVPGAVSGDAVKMFYIGRAAPSRREEAWTTVFADRLIGMAALVALSTLSTLFDPAFMMSRPELRATALVTFALFVGLMGAGTVLALGIGRGSSVAGLLRERLPLVTTLRRAYHSLLRLGQRPGLMAVTFAISFFSHGMAVVTTFVLGHACGENALSFGKYCTIVPVALFSNAIPITPGGIGQGELVLGKLMEWSGGLKSDGVTIMLVYRLMFLVMAMLGALLYATYRGVPPPTLAPAPDDARAPGEAPAPAA